MIVLDSNVISELMRSTPDESVATWIDIQQRDLLCTTSVNVAEILAGLCELPPGRRRANLEQAARVMFEHDLAGRILPFDAEAAEAYSRIRIHRRQLGRPIQLFDALIASIALCAGATVVTRDTGGFDHCGLTIVNPWDGSRSSSQVILE